jgi:hypothetical protein
MSHNTRRHDHWQTYRKPPDQQYIRHGSGHTVVADIQRMHRTVALPPHTKTESADTVGRECHAATHCAVCLCNTSHRAHWPPDAEPCQVGRCSAPGPAPQLAADTERASAWRSRHQAQLQAAHRPQLAPMRSADSQRFLHTRPDRGRATQCHAAAGTRALRQRLLAARPPPRAPSGTSGRPTPGG